MEKLVDKIIDNDKNMSNDEFYTPEKLALRLLLDDLDEDLSGMLLPLNPEPNKENDSASFLFEILITIFMEMIFGLVNLMNSCEDESNNVDNAFSPDMSNFDINAFLPKIKDKFENVGIFLGIIEHNRSDIEKSYEKINNERYCRVILKYYHEDAPLFIKYNVPDNLHYHMLLNESYEKRKK
jgi:hypothetical protein